MMKYRRYFIRTQVLLAALAVSSCLVQNFEETDPIIQPDMEVIQVPCDLISNELVTSSFNIRSNRAWSATLSEGCDWVRVSSMEDNNLANISLDYPIRLEFENNEGEEREAELLIRTNYDEKKVLIRQDAITPRLLISSLKYVDNIAPEGGTFQVDILSNVRWVCSVDGSSTATLSTDRNSGKSNSSVTVTVGESIDQTNMSKGRLRFQAAGCEDQVVEFVQQSANPYIVITSYPERYLYSIGESFSIDIKANSDWTGSIVKGAEYISSFKVGGSTANISSGTFSGTKADKTITIQTIGNSNPDQLADLVLSFTANGGETFELPLQIDKMSHILFDFMPGGKTFESPFKSPTKGSFATSGNSPKWGGERVTLQCFNENITMYITTPASSGVWRNSSQGFRAGASLGTDIREPDMTFIELPVVPGKALAKVCVVNGYNSNLDIRAADNSIVEGGAKQTTSEVGKALEWNLSGTLPDTVYYLVSNAGMGIHQIELWYE